MRATTSLIAEFAPVPLRTLAMEKTKLRRNQNPVGDEVYYWQRADTTACAIVAFWRVVVVANNLTVCKHLEANR